MGPEIVVPLGAFVCAIFLAIGVPLARAYSRRMDADSRNPRLPTEVTDRLERMEHAIDSIAVEVERITEGQRFTTRLLSEGRGASEGRQVPPGGGAAQDRST
jgi:hypothetical protein